MSRPSNRVGVITAAMRVAEEQGITAVTIDSVAAEAGMTKGGPLYHFPNRHALLYGIHTHLAGTWETQLLEALGKPLEDATDQEKVAAYTRVCSQTMTRADLLYIADAGTDEELIAPWEQVSERWMPTIPNPADDGEYDPGEVQLLITRMAADGLWSFEALAGVTLPAGLRDAIVHTLLEGLNATRRAATPTRNGS